MASRVTPSQASPAGVVVAPALALLVETRLQMPLPGASMVGRPALSVTLDRHADRRLTLVAAPTGFGKTTALASWLRGSGRRAAWLSMEALDDHDVRFATYLVSAIHRAMPAVGDTALSALQNPRVDIATDVIGAVINDLAGQEDRLVLVLDDYHLVRNPACHAIVATMLSGLPAQLRVVISTRSDPPLPLGRLRVSGELGEVRADDLRFDPAEARAFLNDELRLDLDPTEIGMLVERTEGWPAALYLAALAMAAAPDRATFIHAFSGSHRHVIDYLASEVIDAQPADTRAFLLRTSVLHRLSGELCDAVAGVSDGASRLAELERSNLFLSALDDGPEWFRFHRMFREANRALLMREHPGLASRLRAAAARWHEGDGTYDEAIRYALEADDHELAGLIVARHHLEYVQGAHVWELRDLTASLDRERLTSSRGAVAFVAALAAGLAGDAEDVVEGHLAEIERFGVGPGIPAGVPSKEAGIAFIRAAFLHDDVSVQRAAGAWLVDAWPGHPWMEGGGRVALAYASYLSGDLDGSRDALGPFGLAVDVHRPLISIFAISVRAMIEIGSGHRALGVEAARAVHEATMRTGHRDTVATAIAHQAFGTALLAEGRPGEALEPLDRALILTRATQALQRADTLLTAARAHAAAGDMNRALVCLAESRALVEGSRDPGALPRKLHAVERALSGGAHGQTDDSAPTTAELRVLRLLPSTLSQRDIARELYLSQDTVKTHVRHLYRKLGARSREEAVDRARTIGLL